MKKLYQIEHFLYFFPILALDKRLSNFGQSSAVYSVKFMDSIKINRKTQLCLK